MAIIIDQESVKAHAVSGDGALGLLYKTLLAPLEGRLLSANHVTVSPQGVTRKHEHEWEQVNYILLGEGVLLTANGEIRPAWQECVYISPPENSTGLRIIAKRIS